MLFFFYFVKNTYGPQHQKTYLRTCAVSEDSDHTAWRIFTECILDNQGCKVSSCRHEDSDQTAQMRRLI